MEHIILHVTYTGEKGKAKAFAEAMMSGGLQQAVLNEDGCMQYHYFVPVGGDDTQVVLLEKWRDGAALEAHMNGEPMVSIKALKESFALDTVLERYE